jgi:hypothetical protein
MALLTELSPHASTVIPRKQRRIEIHCGSAVTIETYAINLGYTCEIHRILTGITSSSRARNGRPKGGGSGLDKLG